MAGVQFQVDAVLNNGSLSNLQNQINNVKANLNLTINNKQALKSIQQVEAQFHQIKSVNGEWVSITDKIKSGYTEVTQTLTKNNDIITTTKNNYAQQQKDIDSFNKRNLSAIDFEIQKREQASQRFSSQLKSQMQVQAEQSNQMYSQQSNLIKQIGQTERSMVGTTGEVNTAYQQKLNFLKGQLGTLEQQDVKQGILTQQQKDSLNTLKNQQQLENNITQAKHDQAEQQKMINTRQQNLGQMLISTIAHYAMYMVAMKLWTGVAESISDCVNYTKDLNEAMTNIRVVTMDTKEATEGLLDTYNQLGQELGASTTDIAEGAVDWLRQGYSTGDTTELVKDSTILSKLALLDNAEATEYLTSALKGYKLEAQDAIGVIDQLVSIDLEAATSAGDMAEALSRTANMARTTGFEMNEVLGMIATMSEVTQNSAKQNWLCVA